MPWPALAPAHGEFLRLFIWGIFCMCCVSYLLSALIPSTYPKVLRTTSNMTDSGMYLRVRLPTCHSPAYHVYSRRRLSVPPPPYYRTGLQRHTIGTFHVGGLVKAYLARIEEASEFRAVLQVNPEALLAASKADEDRLRLGSKGFVTSIYLCTILRER
jgi:hypothetical protein